MSGEPVRGKGHRDLRRDLVSRSTARLRPLTEALVRTTPSSVVWFRPTSHWGFVLPWSGFTDALTPLPWPLMALTTEFLSPRHPTEDTKPQFFTLLGYEQSFPNGFPKPQFERAAPSLLSGILRLFKLKNLYYDEAGDPQGDQSMETMADEDPFF